MQVTVIYAPGPRQTDEVVLTLAEPCSVLQALQQSGLLQKYPEIDHPHLLIGVWGRKVNLQQLLREQDRVEVYRPLRVDPKVARRERFVKQGAGAAGLFVKKRPGAKAGY
ncbi:RnfH family protein [Rhodoferax sp.]|uniref:RnfH family protein n=1 Tax=Rhodoferax sp. TaxID=50421 RepID=UPI002613B968|nr:RnfH family protein [Rhodoferax sp.]MDD2923668.1 RnfH family protein [Rhodoferax sp.]